MRRAFAVIGAVRDSGVASLRAFFAFLRRPDTDAVCPSSKPVLGFWLLFFSFAATALFALLALPFVVTSDVALGENLDRALGRPALAMIVAVVVLGPLIEELIFRGWLPGTPKVVAGAALCLLVVYGGAWLLRAYAPEWRGIGAQIGLAAVGLLLFAAAQRGGPSATPGWYKAAFPFLFWLQGIVFGGLHFANIASASIAIPLLMTAPLVLAGWLWGYARIVLGFGWAWLLHIAYNAPAVLAAALMAQANFP